MQDLQMPSEDQEILQQNHLFNLEFCGGDYLNMLPSPHFSTNDRSDKF